jgi:hypothetical protein
MPHHGQLRPLSLLPFFAGPLAGLLGVTLLPKFPNDDAAASLTGIAAQPNRWLIANLLLLASFLLIIPALLTLTEHLRIRAPRLGPIAGWVSVVGFALHLGLVGFVMAQLPLARSGAQGAEAVAEQMFSSPAFIALLVPMLLTTTVGLVLLTVAVWRTAIAPRWAALTLTAGIVWDFAAPEEITGVQISGVGIFVFLAIGLGAIGLHLRTHETTERFPAVHAPRAPGAEMT